jgi:hypothetical protein
VIRGRKQENTMARNKRSAGELIMPKYYPNSRMSTEIEATIGQWFYVMCHCLVQFPAAGSGVTTSFFYECAACGNKNLRFIHILEHEETEKQISVGIECARVLLADGKLPRLAENETKRKERWRQHYGTPGRCSTDEQDLIDRGKI